MVESEPSNHHWDEQTKQAFLARVLDGFGLPVEQISVEDVGIPGRGMEDEENPSAQANLDEDLFERGT